jgi:hypothetical protein
MPYAMTAEENFDSTRVTAIAALTTWVATNYHTDQQCPGIQWDAVRRNLMYMAIEDIPSTPLTNTTGHTLWNGANSFAPGAAIDPSTQFNSSVGVKNIDTGTVTFHLNYDATKLVPNGIGGGDGTWRRATIAFATVGNGPGMTDPYTGNYWVNSQSCQLYCFRLSDSYAQIISPLFPVVASDNNVQITGFTNTGATNPWAFARETEQNGSNPVTSHLYLIPRLITAAETSADYLLIYASYAYPRTCPSQLFHSYNREIFDHAGNMYVFSCVPSGGKDFKLYRFAPPTAANYPTAAVGGGFTDITPWAPAGGPNADATDYTLLRNVVSTAVETPPVIPMYLPATDDLVLIEKFFPIEHTASSYDPALMSWSCTYVHAPAGTPTWDHHSAFVTGYMSADWAPTSIGSAAYSVIDAFEVNAYLGQSDYDYSGDIPELDYTKRWFFFVCTKMTAGVSDGKPRIVLVEYKFVYGSAPSVVQVIDEQGWDDAYPSYAPRNNDVYAPYTSVATQAVAVSMATLLNSVQYYWLWDVGIHDPVTNAFWWSGGGTDSSGNGGIATFCQFDSQFVDRMKKDDNTPGAPNIAATPPFMKLVLTPLPVDCQSYAQVLGSSTQPCTGVVGY